MSYSRTDADEHTAPPGDASLFDMHGPVIFAYLRMHTPSREDAEDLTMEVFLAALERDNLSALQAEEHLLWLRRVAHNKLVDSYRRNERRPLIGLDRIAEKLLEHNCTDPEHSLLQREQYNQLYQAIAKLPTLQQQVLRLRYADNLRFAQIAVLLDKREDAVRKLLSRTLATLRTHYEGPGGERRSFDAR